MKIMPSKRILSVTIATALFVPVAAAQYRCVENGRTILTDRPCGETATKPVAASRTNAIADKGDSAYATHTGDWRGQVQYQSMLSGQPVSDAHAVVPLVLSIQPQGKVTGISTENGCKLKGLLTPGTMPQVATVDVTLSECGYGGFNRRMSGTIALYPARKYVQLYLYALPVIQGKAAQSFEVKGTLRR